MVSRSEPTPFYRKLDGFSRRPGSQLLAGLWGLAEATLFFIVPDVYLGLLALVNPRRGALALLVALAGGVIGGLVMYGLAAWNGAGTLAVVLRVPLIKPAMAQTEADQLSDGAWGAFITGAWQGIPYKVFAVQAARGSMPWPEFFLASVVARLERFLPVAAAAGIAGHFGRRVIQKRTRLVVAVYLGFWLVVYAYYFVSVNGLLSTPAAIP